MKKFLALLLVAIMALGMVPAMADEPVEVSILFEGCSVSDDAAVVEKLNEYLIEKIGVKVRPIWGSWADFDDKAMNAINSGDDSIDMMFTCAWTDNGYAPFSKKGAFVRLDDPEDNLLEQYGQEVWALLPDVLKNAAVVDGADGEGVYGIPGFKDIATVNSWDLNKTLLAKYGYTVEDVKNAGFYGWNDILKTVKEGEGESFYPMYFEGAVTERMVDGTTIISGDEKLLMAYYYDKEHPSTPGAYGNTFVNRYATPEYEAYAKQMREYFLAGYIHPSLAIGDLAVDTWRNAQNNAEYLISSEVTVYGYEFTTSALRGIDVEYLYTNFPYTDTTSLQGALFAISANSNHPVESMKFLNLLATDPYVMTLMTYGAEGIHYNLNAEGEVEFTDKHSEYTTWTNGMGNTTILPPEKGQGKNFREEFKEFYFDAEVLQISGFNFDITPVKNEVAACINVTEQYTNTLNTGAGDVDTILPELLQKMEEAGIQKVLDEANAQFQAFLAAK